MKVEYIISSVAQDKKQIEVIEFEMEIHNLDLTTRLHQIKVAQLCEKIGKKMRLSEKELSDLTQAAEIHDLGKIGIPPEILNKPGKLTEEEFAIIKLHSEIGVEILKYNEIILSEEVLEIVKNHHETLDGEGYPGGLKGNKLNKQCRILTVADRYEALIAKRTYKEAMDKQKAFQILAEDVNNGKIDSSVVQALKEIVKEKTISRDAQKTRSLNYEKERLTL